MTTPRLSELDDKIRRAMRADADGADAPTEEGLFDMLAEVFRGRRRWINLYGFFLSFVFLGLAVWCAVRFFGAQETQSQIGWAAGFLWSSLSVAMLKMWFWMEMHKNQVLREVKRLELQVLRLSQRVGS